MLKRLIVVIAIPILFLSWSQGCSRVSFFDTGLFNQKEESQASPTADSGNGGTYDGKLRVLHHYVDGFQCEGKPQPESILIRKDLDQWDIIKNSKEKCAVVDQTPVAGVVYDDVKKEATFEGKLYVVPKPYFVDANEPPNLPDANPLDAVCEDANGKCSVQAALQTAEVASYTSGVDVSIPVMNFKLAQELGLTSGPNGHAILVHGAGPTMSTFDGQGATNILRIYGVSSSGPVNLQGLNLINGFLPYRFPPAGKSSASALENNSPAQLNLSDMLFQGNNGADVFQTTKTGGGVQIQKTRFLGNNPDLWVIRFEYIVSGQLILDQVEISNNKISVAGGALIATQTQNGVAVIVKNSLISHMVGGCALYFHDVEGALIENTTIANNEQQALSNFMDGSDTAGDIVFRNSTIFNNGRMTGWGQSNLYAMIKGSVQMLDLQNTVVFQNDPTIANCITYAPVVKATNSLFDDTTCRPTGSSNLNGDPKLASLANNGGFASTMLPLAGSPLIDAGENLNCPSTDQRGQARPIDKQGGGAKCDIGAVELQ